MAYSGECENTGDLCQKNSECKEGAYCATPTGECGAFGICTPKPEACIDLFDPVCGCDANTYGNGCEAAAAGVSVAHEGECEPPVKDCEANTDCADGEYCAHPAGGCDLPGKCTAKPDACPAILAPVCGCSGATYSNECHAAQQGESVAHDGPCETTGGCESDADCASADGALGFCQKPFGKCEGAGTCATKPDACPDVWQPVCGCDNVTYGNECEAAAVGANVAHEGECEPDNLCSSNTDCDPGQYCQKNPGACEAKGECVAKPELCLAIYAPVCGCDGQTYGNDCKAAAAGVNGLHEGACEGTNACENNDQCAGKSYCAKPDGACDGAGECAPMPDVCPAIYAPVCGCNGATYGNECEAAAAGLTVLHDGECEPKVCETNDDCPAGSGCFKAVGDCGGVGECQELPDVCPLYFVPFCGCDGKTWPSPCEAVKNGVDIAANGACKEGCTVEILCQVGFVPFDSDGDGCNDSCKPTCGVVIDCAQGYVAVDSDGDGCNDTCKAECEKTCDCYEKLGNEFEKGCPLLCAGCGNFWGCVAGVCEAHCGVIPDEVGQCAATCEKNEDCGLEGYYCAKAGNDCDGVGFCAPKPKESDCAAQDEFQLICGCDGQQYESQCWANHAGTNVLLYGSCDGTALPNK